MNNPNQNRIAAAQRGLDYASCYAAATGAPTAQRKRTSKSKSSKSTGARAARGCCAARSSRPARSARAERRRTVDAIERLIEGLYAHLPLKRARYAFDPVQRLRILRGQLDTLSDAGFHIELADILTRLRDAHTTLPGPARAGRRECIAAVFDRALAGRARDAALHRHPCRQERARQAAGGIHRGRGDRVLERRADRRRRAAPQRLRLGRARRHAARRGAGDDDAAPAAIRAAARRAMGDRRLPRGRCAKAPHAARCSNCACDGTSCSRIAWRVRAPRPARSTRCAWP